MGHERFDGDFDPNRAPGRKGVDVFILDQSNSMTGPKTKILIQALQAAIQDRPKAQLIAFGDTARVVPLRNISRGSCNVGMSTELCPALKLAIPMQPERTVIISDGCIYDEYGIFQAIPELTGSVSTIITYGSKQPYCADRELMQKIARRGRGEFSQWQWRDPGELYRQISRKPFLKPEAVEVHYETQYHHHHLPPKHFHHGKPQDVDIHLDPARVNVSYRPALPPQRHEALPASKYRGTLQSAPQPLQIEQQRQLPTLAPVKKKTGWFW